MLGRMTRSGQQHGLGEKSSSSVVVSRECTSPVSGPSKPSSSLSNELAASLAASLGPRGLAPWKQLHSVPEGGLCRWTCPSQGWRRNSRAQPDTPPPHTHTHTHTHIHTHTHTLTHTRLCAYSPLEEGLTGETGELACSVAVLMLFCCCGLNTSETFHQIGRASCRERV